MTPRVLLLLESRATGGVTTIATTLAAALRAQGWDVAECVVRGNRLSRLWRAARASEVLLATHNFLPAYAGWLLSMLVGKPLVVWVHGPVTEVLAEAGASPLRRRALAWFYRRLSSCVFVSRASKDSFERFLGGLPARLTATVVGNAVPAAPAAGADARLPAGPIELAYVGRLSPEKQPLLLLEVLRLLPQRFRLTVVGDGPLADALARSGAELIAAGRLTLAGQRRVDPGLYGRWHLTLLASKYEGCPMSVLESLAYGVPCVAVPIAATCELLAEDAPCLLAREPSAQAMADAIQQVLQVPHEQLAARMAKILQRHNMEDFARQWQQVLRTAASPC